MMQPASFTPRYAVPMGVMFPSLGELGATIQQETGVIGSTVASATVFIPVVGPLVSAAVAAATSFAIAIEGLFAGCGQTCTEATTIANQVEAQLRANLQNYLSQPTHYASVQQASLGVFDRAWSLLLQNCGNPALGSAGQRCISERQRGGVAPWCPNPGHTGCDWFILYRDQIANDPNVVPDPTSSSSSTVQMQAVTNPDGSVSYVQVPSSSSFGLPMPLLLGAAALLLFVMMGAKK